MKRVIESLMVLLTAIVLLSGCGDSPEGPSTFFRHDQSGAMTVSWTDDGGGHLTGSLQHATPNPASTGEPLQTVDASFAGTLNDGRISLVTNGFPGVTSTWTGTLSGDSLTLNIPQKDGAIAPAAFARGTVSDYNAAVSALKGQVIQKRARATSDAASAAAAAAAEADSVAAAAALAAADKQVADGVVALRGSLSDGLSFGRFDKDMATLKNDLQTTRADALKATSAGAAAIATMDACADASTAQGDASSVGGDESAIGADQSTAQVAIDSVAVKVASLRNAQAAMQTAYQQQGLTPSGSERSVMDLLNRADAAMKTWKTKVAGYGASAHQLATQAVAIADAAAKAVC